MRPKLLFAMAADKTRHVFDAATIDRLEQSCDLLQREPVENFADPEGRRLLGEAEILVTGWGCPMITPDILRAAPKLKLIAHAAGTV